MREKKKRERRKRIQRDERNETKTNTGGRAIKNRKREGKKTDLCLCIEKKNHNRTTVTLLHRRQHCHREPPAPPTSLASQLSPLILFLLLHFTLPSLFTLHVNSGELLHYLLSGLVKIYIYIYIYMFFQKILSNFVIF
jgi:hypothetical protein